MKKRKALAFNSLCLGETQPVYKTLPERKYNTLPKKLRTHVLGLIMCIPF